MANQIKKCLIVLMAVVLVTSGIPIGHPVYANEQSQNSDRYEIYPTPQDIQYHEGEFVIRTNANVVFERTIDQPTKDRTNEIFDAKKVSLSESDHLVEGTTNILVGTEGSEGFVDKYFDENVSSNADFFQKTDSYILYVTDGTIAILGKNTDAAFYGVTTLKHILNQIEGKTIHNLQINDFASTKVRGFIEGYYGIPWTDQDRISLMEFGGDFKMTSYIFAPKDDPYHNSQWRKPYPEERLNEIKKMVDAGKKNKVKFAFTIHPYMHNGINESNYDEGIEAIKDKFNQLYDIGVRQFGVLGDDAGGISPELVVRVMNDLDEWAEKKGDIYDFITVPAGYNTAWANWNELDVHDAGFSEDTHIMWTGDSVLGHITQQTIDNFKTRNRTEEEGPRRDPVFWLNWPVNDVNMNRLLMGKGEMLNKGVTGLGGVVSNPMQDAEPSKVALFAVGDYAWNVNDFNEDKSWYDSFKYVDENAGDALRTLARHMQDPKPNSHGLVLSESEEIKPLLEQFNQKYNANESIIDIGNTLIEEFEKIAKASDTFMQNSQNERMKEQVEPFAKSLKDLAHASIAFINTAIALENNNDNAVWANFSQGKAAYDSSKTHDRPVINGTKKALPGSKRLIPFAENLKESLSSEVNQLLNVEQLVMKPISNYGNGDIYQGKLENLIDGDDSSKVWFNRYIAQGDYVGIEFNKPISIKGLKVLQGKNAADKDAFFYGKFQYFDAETEQWKDTTGTSHGEYKNVVEESGLDITTTKVRFIVDPSKPIKGEGENNPKWAAFREFSIETEEEIDTEPLEPSLIRTDDWIFHGGTNDVSALTDDNSSSYIYYDPRNNPNDVTLEGDYLGLDLGRKIKLGKVNIELGVPNNLNDKFEEFDLQYSTDGETYQTYKSYSNVTELEEDLTSEEITARYVRIKNTKEITRWLGFRTFKVEAAKYNLDAYTNANTIDLKSRFDKDRFELQPAQGITLKDGEYVGLKLDRIHDLNQVTTDLSASAADLQLQVAKNEYEWTTVDDPTNVPSARYIRLLNTTGSDVTFDINAFVATSTEYEPLHIEDFTFNEPNGLDQSVDGDLTTATVFKDHQRQGKHLIYDIGQEIDLDQLEIYVHDSTLDFIYDGIVSVSTDKKNWEKVMEIGDQEPNDNRNADINDSFPNHKVSYNTVLAENINKRAKYIKIETTQDVNRWVQINELVINDGKYYPVANNATFDATVMEEKGGEPSNLIDGDLNTMYIPSEGNGKLTYHISENNDRNSITILQGKGNAGTTVKARMADKATPENDELVTLGTLNQSLNRFVIPSEKLLYDIEIDWNEEIPQIYELSLTETSDTSVDKTALQQAIDQDIDTSTLTTSSVNAYQEALSLAQHILDNPYVAQISVDSAKIALTNAIDQVETKGDASVLQEAVEQARDLDKTLYTESSWSELELVLQEADEKLSNPDNLSVTDVETLTNKINQAKDNLKYEIISKENAMIALEDAKAFNSTISNPDETYTQESYQAFIDAITALEALLEKDETTAVVPTKFVEAKETLENAKNSLVDIAELSNLLDESDAILENEALYTASSFQAYQDAITTGKEVAKTGTEAQVQEAITTIKEMKKDLAFAGDTSSLKSAVEEYDQLAADHYTEESFNTFETKLNEAKAMLEANDATDKEIAQMTEQLKTTYNDLVNVKHLKEKIAQAQAFNESNYTPASYQTLSDALQDMEAKGILKNGDADAVQSAIESISSAMEQLVMAADHEKVNALLKSMKDITIDNYTTESAKDFKEVLDELIAFSDSDNASATDFAALKSSMLNAKDSLVSVKELKTELQEAKDINAKDYVASSYSKLVNAMEQAENLLANGTEAEISEAIDQINVLSANLLSKEALQSAKEAVENAEESLNNEDFDKATKLVNKLPDSTEKENLLLALSQLEDQVGQGNNKEDGSSEDEGQDKNEELPNTSTNMFNLIAFALLLIVGSIVMLSVKRRNNK
ncbi:Hyaluronoglucosaminidase precursor [Paraliobacillus sp. PM-2]|uniref:beta-N-acetylglucosaminidase domain-containing protein n=1 Tax=Paraliobacillus sp. PM-2 TaxID=1462524 RepID=UPI00061BE963|nr:beta-N-acetylglucosaminidase domain-containing protein [Paraliobacillus sp. PM-2]CQR46315.1 Hyaluronoglucosaminidase precursor [Paraliobacillus sp. PM-2]